MAWVTQGQLGGMGDPDLNPGTQGLMQFFTPQCAAQIFVERSLWALKKVLGLRGRCGVVF